MLRSVNNLINNFWFHHSWNYLKINDNTLVEQIRAGSNSCDFENSHELEPHELEPAQILTRTNFGIK